MTPVRARAHIHTYTHTFTHTCMQMCVGLTWQQPYKRRSPKMVKNIRQTESEAPVRNILHTFRVKDRGHRGAGMRGFGGRGMGWRVFHSGSGRVLIEDVEILVH